jgi:hypothetical protein
MIGRRCRARQACLGRTGQLKEVGGHRWFPAPFLSPARALELRDYFPLALRRPKPRCEKIAPSGKNGDPSRIRTCNPRSRNPLLYPVELWDRNFEKPELHSIANMKNPLPGQACSEPFSPAWRQSLSGGGLCQVRRQRNAVPQPAAGVARVGHGACDFFATPFRRHESVTF